LRIGAENVANTYPAEATNQVVRGLIYLRNAPYDTDGGQITARRDEFLMAIVDRRLFFAGCRCHADGGTGVGGGRAGAFPSAAIDEIGFLKTIAAQYDVMREATQLENGNWGMTARPVLDAYERNQTDLDYDSMQVCMENLGPRRGVSMVQIALPELATR
jgi:hypothetical protein